MTSSKLIKEKYLDMLLDSAEAVLSVFGFNRSLFGLIERKPGYDEIYQQLARDVKSQNQNYKKMTTEFRAKMINYNKNV